MAKDEPASAKASLLLPYPMAMKYLIAKYSAQAPKGIFH
jgi:hypothetical protein